MGSPRIGQLLSRLVPLSEHDLEEILQEQKHTRQRFGDIALSLGMVQPQQVWQAWIQQLESTYTEIDLDALGIDTQALDHLSADIAHQYRVVPVRVSEHELVIACSSVLDGAQHHAIERQTDRHVVFACAKAGQVERAIQRHYPAPSRKSEAA